MKAIGINKPVSVGELCEHLTMFTCERPRPKRGEVLIKVYNSTINIDDIHAIEGSMMGGLQLKPKASERNIVVPGSDVAGIVAELGEGVTDFKIGQRVYGICTMNQQYGPWATFCIASEKHISEIPQNIKFTEVVSLPIAGTMAVKCVNAAGTLEGKTCLVIGASGGIGTLCIQALQQKKAQIYGVCSSKNKTLIEGLGVGNVLAYDGANYQYVLRELYGKFDVVFDFVGGEEKEKIGRDLLKPGGQFITVVGPNEWIGQEKLNKFQMMHMFTRIGMRMLFYRLFTRKKYKFIVFKTPEFNQLKNLFIQNNKIPVVDSYIQFSVSKLRKAVERVLKHQTTGRVVINIDPQANN